MQYNQMFVDISFDRSKDDNGMLARNSKSISSNYLIFKIFRIEIWNKQNVNNNIWMKNSQWNEMDARTF